jgi:eukaryotic-like serine/threonine-protein kinase
MYRLAEYDLDVQRQHLLKGSQRIDLAKKPFLILVYLVENRDRLVMRRELLDHFWDGKDVYDQNLTKAIGRIRKALGELPGESRFLETRWAVGYQYIGPFEVVLESGQELRTAAEGIPPASQTESQFDADSRAGPSPPITGRTVFPHQIKGLVVAAVLLVGILVGSGLRLRHPLPSQLPVSPSPNNSAPVLLRKTVAILSFRNLGKNPDEDWLGSALAEMLSTDLSSDGRIRTLPGETVARAATELRIDRQLGLSSETLSAVSRDLYADLVVTGSYLILDPKPTPRARIRVDVKVQDARTGESIASFSETGRFEKLFTMASAAGSRLVASLDLPGAPLQGGNPASLIPSRPEVTVAYLRGLEDLRSGNLSASISHLEDAVSQEPAFPLSHLALGDAWSELGYQEKAQAETKLAASLSRSLDREHRLLIQARSLEMMGDWDKAADTYRALFTFFPDNVEYGLKLAFVQTAGGKPHDADATISLLRKLPAPVDDDPRIDLAEAAAAQALSDSSRAAQATQRAEEKAKRNGSLLLYANILSMHAGSLAGSNMGATIRESEEAREICAKFNDIECQANILRRMGIFQVDTDPQAAETDLKQALALARKIGNPSEQYNDLNGLAAILSNKGNLPAADEMYEEALKGARQINSAWGIQMTLNNLGNNLLLEGKPVRAEQMESQALAISRQIGLKEAIGDELVSLAPIYQFEGDLEHAMSSVEEGLAIFNELKNRQNQALALSTRADVERLQGKFSLAQNDLQAALSTLENDGDQGDLAATRLASARLYLSMQDAHHAAKLASSAAEGFFTQKRPADEACARAILALALMQYGERDAARAEMRKAQELIDGQQGHLAQLEVQIDTALFEARDPALHSITELHSASSRMREVSSNAQRDHLAMIALEARLAQEEIEARRGDRRESVARARAIEFDARRSGFVLFADQASGFGSQLAIQKSNNQTEIRIASRESD